MANNITKTFTVTKASFLYADTENKVFGETAFYPMLGEYKNDELLLAIQKEYRSGDKKAIIPYEITESTVYEEKREMPLETFLTNSVSENGKKRGVSYVMRTISKTKAMCKVVNKMTGEMNERYVYCDSVYEDMEKTRKAFDKANSTKHPEEIVCFVGEKITVEDKRFMEENLFYILSSRIESKE